MTYVDMSAAKWAALVIKFGVEEPLSEALHRENVAAPELDWPVDCLAESP